MLDYEEETDEFDEDNALADEDLEQPKKTINQSGVRGGTVDVVPEDSVAPADREGEVEEDPAAASPSYPPQPPHYNQQAWRPSSCCQSRSPRWYHCN